MDIPDDSVLDVDLLPDDGSEEESEAPPSSGELTPKTFIIFVAYVLPSMVRFVNLPRGNNVKSCLKLIEEMLTRKF